MTNNPVQQPGLWTGSHGRADWRGSAGGGLVSDHVELDDLVDDGDAAYGNDDLDDEDDLVDDDDADDDDCN